MSTINLSGIEFEVIYIDPSIENASDGSTPELALSDLPAFNNLQNNTAYLIRRLGTSYKLTFPTGTSSTPSLNYAFIGMPKSTDPMYEMVPSEAKTAWGNDSLEVDYAYANANSNGFTLSGSNIIFNSYRLYFYHHDLTSSPSTGMLNFSSTDYTNLITFENCRFGYLEYELDDNIQFSSMPSYGMRGYISCGKIRSFEIRGCKIDFNANYDSYNFITYAITISNKKNCSISNTDVNIVCNTSNQSIGKIFELCTDSTTNNYDNENYTHLYGLTFNLFKYATFSNQTNYIPFCILDRNSSFVEAKNISVSMPQQNQIGNGTVTTLEVPQSYNSSLNYALGVFVLDKVQNFDIDGVIISLPQFWKVGVNSSYDSSSLFIVKSNNESYDATLLSSSPGQMNTIKNIKISCAQGEGTGLDSENATGDYYSNISNSKFAAPMSCIRLYNSSKRIWGISNISIFNPHGVAAEIYGCWFEASSVSGTIRAGASSTVNISNLSTWYAGKAIGIFGNATVKVDTLTCGTGGSLNPTDELACVGEICSSQGFLYVGTSNRQLLTDTRMNSSSSSNAYSAICANEKYTGRYMMRTENYLCSTYGTFRTYPSSSVKATLKLQNNWCNASTGIVLGQSPFGGFQKTISSVGKHVLYIYGATLDLGSRSDVFAAIGRNIIVEVIIPTSSGKRSVFSTSGSWVLDTTSTWSDSNISATDGDATGFPVYLKLPLNIDITNSSVDIKIYYNWYSSNGVFFLDPFFSVSE